jgi:hypothetical protein
MNGGLPDPGLRNAAPSEGSRLTQLPQRAPRKRRRPALSCVQCRRRKVKCDRQLPCTQCSQYNNTTCVYDDPEVAAHGKPSTTATPTLYGTSSIHPPNELSGPPHPEEPFSLNRPSEFRNSLATCKCSVGSGFDSRVPPVSAACL